LLSFVAAAKQQDADSPGNPVIDSVARPPIDANFRNTLPKRLAIAKVAGGQQPVRGAKFLTTA